MYCRERVTILTNALVRDMKDIWEDATVRTLNNGRRCGIEKFPEVHGRYHNVRAKFPEVHGRYHNVRAKPVSGEGDPLYGIK